jgi:uncharacterized protein
MKFVLLLAVLLVAVGWIAMRSRGSEQRPSTPSRRDARPTPDAAPMLACAHCGVHLPRADAAFDPAGRAYCSPEHRIAGPR